MGESRAVRTSGKKGKYEAEQTLEAIRSGCVDAFVVEESDGHRVYALQGTDLPYYSLVEGMQQGAAMLTSTGDIVYCNPNLATLLAISAEQAIGVSLHECVDEADKASCQRLLDEAQFGPTEAELRLKKADGTLIPAKFSFRTLSQDKSRIGVLITDLTSQKQLADLASHILRVTDEERRRIARDLHDSVGQLVVAVTMDHARIKKEAQKLGSEATDALQHSIVTVDEIGKEIRTIAHLLHPPLLDEVGLSAALRWYIEGFAQRSGITANLMLPGELVRLAPELEIAIFRVVQECLTNIHRHANAQSCRVELVQHTKNLVIEVTDSGKGSAARKQPPSPMCEGVGLRGMRERVRQLGGALDINFAENGTTVTATLPMHGPEF